MVLVTVCAIACGGGSKRPQPVSNAVSEPAKPSTFDAFHAQLSTIADQVCACADVECAMNAMEPLNTLPKDQGEGDTQDQRNRLADAADRALGCIDKLSKDAGQP